MGFISTVDLQTKMDVQELLSRFCHFLDHNKATEWSRLFTVDCRIDLDKLGVFQGRDAILEIPRMVNDLGAGHWRHHLSNVMIDRTGSVRELEVNAYCIVTDWGRDGSVVHYADFSARLQNRCHWQIMELTLTSVGAEEKSARKVVASDMVQAGATLN